MGTATLSNHTLEIDGMTGDACVQKVTGALKGVAGVTTQSVKVGSATISADGQGCTAACAAIGKAGYKARDGDEQKNANTDAQTTPDASEGSKTAGTSPQQTGRPQNDRNDRHDRNDAGKQGSPTQNPQQGKGNAPASPSKMS